MYYVLLTLMYLHHHRLSFARFSHSFPTLRNPLHAMKVATLARMGLVHVAAAEYLWPTKYGRIEDVLQFNLRRIGLRLLGIL
jgi:hypothetical protein